MINKKDIEKIVIEKLTDTSYFLVDVLVSKDNNIAVEIGSFDFVDIDFCIELSREIEKHFDRDIEDFDLEVGSAGLSSPFKVEQQYQKNIGKEVEVLTKNGLKYVGILTSSTENTFCIQFEKLEKQEGCKRKTKVQHEVTFEKENIKYIKHLIRFK